MTNQEIFDGIARRDNRTFLYLYNEYQGQIQRMVEKNSGSVEDALDIFQEGIIALWTNIKQGKFQLRDNAKVSSYLFSLCRNLWISKLRKRKDFKPLDESNELSDKEETEAMLTQHEMISELERHFRQLGESCRKLLSLFYYQKVSLKAIAQQLEITEKTAKNNKYRCMQNLRSLYQKNVAKS
ncbi:MAG: sigma-70 family RNA polymerase sigma factor [Saprospiraceae bacterium]|nr:sigma-70 family RNA polymerase sigma factor [Saprospiraceae bacterium]